MGVGVVQSPSRSVEEEHQVPPNAFSSFCTPEVGEGSKGEDVAKSETGTTWELHAAAAGSFMSATA